MPYSRTRRSLFLGLLLFTVACLLFSACGGTQSQGAQQKVKLKFVSWIGGDQLPIYQGVIKRFEAAHPNIAVDYEVLPFDQLGTQLKARFNADTAPDVMALFAGGFKDQFVDANDLLDLSNESWVPQIADNAKTASLSKDGKKTVVMPISGSAVGVVYNKKLLQDHNVAVPKTWSEFLQACATLKTAGITPITIGSKDVWPIGWMPDAMSLQTIYRENPNYGTDIIANKVKYATTPAWNQVFEDIKTLNTSSYIDKNNLGTDYQSSMDLLATGKAAMSITIQSSVGTAKKTNPDVSLGMFPLPWSGASQ